MLIGEPLVLFVATFGGGKPEDRDVYAGVGAFGDCVGRE